MVWETVNVLGIQLLAIVYPSNNYILSGTFAHYILVYTHSCTHITLFWRFSVRLIALHSFGWPIYSLSYRALSFIIYRNVVIFCMVFWYLWCQLLEEKKDNIKYNFISTVSVACLFDFSFITFTNSLHSLTHTHRITLYFFFWFLLYFDYVFLPFGSEPIHICR